MKKIKLFLILIFVISVFETESFSQERKKLAQTGLKFLSVPLDARATGLGDAVTSLEMSASSMFYNPSTMAELNNSALVSFGTTRWIADINYIFGSAAINLFDGKYGVFALSMVAVDYGEFQRTIFAPTDDGYLDVGTFEPKAYAFGIGYANTEKDNSAVLILECKNEDEANKYLSSLPLVKEGLIKFSLMSLIPYSGFERLFSK